MSDVTEDRVALIASLEQIDIRLRWLSRWTVHNANDLRPKRDGLKVGGHQASCASMTTVMAALFFHALRANDKVAVKPHTGPVLHAIHYLLGQQSLGRLKAFRGLGEVQSYPSRTKDAISVDFSTGSVGDGPDKWYLSLLANNIANRDIKAGSVVSSSATGAFIIAQYLPPLAVGVTIGKHS